MGSGCVMRGHGFAHHTSTPTEALMGASRSRGGVPPKFAYRIQDMVPVPGHVFPELSTTTRWRMITERLRHTEALCKK